MNGVDVSIGVSWAPWGFRWHYHIQDSNGEQLAHAGMFFSKRRAWRECNAKLRELGYQIVRWKELEECAT